MFATAVSKYGYKPKYWAKHLAIQAPLMRHGAWPEQKVCAGSSVVSAAEQARCCFSACLCQWCSAHRHAYRGNTTKIQRKMCFTGVTSPVVANAPINAILFAVEHRAVHFFTHWHGSAGWSDAQKQFAAGAMSGLTQTPLACSAERVKILLQVEHKSQRPAYTGPVSAMQFLLARGGLRSLYSGMALTIARDVPAFGVYFSTYHGLKRRLKRWKAERAGAAGTAPSPPSALHQQ